MTSTQVVPVASKARVYALKASILTDVTAIQYLGKPDPEPAPADTFDGLPTREDPNKGQVAVLVPTSRGGHPAFSGDWIVTDHAGQMSVVSDSDFTEMYAVDPATGPGPVATAPQKPALPAPPAAPQKPAPPAPKPEILS